MAVAEQKPPVTPQQSIPTGNAPDPFTEPIAYLRFHKWKFLGNPEHQNCRLVDPTKPLKAFTTTEPIMIFNKEGQREQIMARTGEGDKVKPGERLIYHPAGVPVSMQEALLEQIERDSRREEEALAAQNKAAVPVTSGK